MTNINVKTIDVAAYAHFGGETLYVATIMDDLVTSGMCRTETEARARIEAYMGGGMPMTEAPNYQANTSVMMRAYAKFATMAIRDGGACKLAVEAALRAGLHTVEWAIASRYLVAGWV